MAVEDAGTEDEMIGAGGGDGSRLVGGAYTADAAYTAGAEYVAGAAYTVACEGA